MTIITHLDQKIKDKATKWSEKKLITKEIAAHMLRAGLKKRAYAIATCAEEVTFSMCDECGKVSVHHASLCRDRLCPICSWRLAIQRYNAMRDILRYISDLNSEYCYCLMTLTVPNCRPDALGATLKGMAEAWNRIKARKIFAKDVIAGWARATEITYNAKTQMLHPHYHVIVAFRDDDAADELSYDLLKEWCFSYRGEGRPSVKGQDIRRIGAKDIEDDTEMTGAVLETFKYTQKSSDLLEMPVKILRIYADQIAGKRMIAFGGIFKDAKRILCIDDMEEASENNDTFCHYCGSLAVHEVLCRWTGIQYEPVL